VYIDEVLRDRGLGPTSIDPFGGGVFHLRIGVRKLARSVIRNEHRSGLERNGFAAGSSQLFLLEPLADCLRYVDDFPLALELAFFGLLLLALIGGDFKAF